MVPVQNRLKNFFRPEVLALHGYTPGEQPRRAFGVVKLNTNENPYPPSSAVRRALKKFDPRLLRLYPDPTASGLRKRLAKIYRWPEEGVLVSNGSDEILAMLFRAAVGRGMKVQCPDPTYSLYPILCAERGGRLREVPLDDRWVLDFSRLDPRAHLTLFGYPNPPIGNLFPKNEILRFCRKAKGLVLIDEAYADFSGDSCLEVARRCANVVVLRTVSKSFSLAGLQLGYAFCHPRVAAELSKVKDSYNLDRLALTLGEAAFSPTGCRESAANVRRVVKERDRLTRDLRRSAFRVEDSRANFIWVRCPGPRSAREIYACLKARGVLVRWFPYPRLRDGLRITVGDKRGNDRLLAELKRVTALRPNRGAAARSR
jgi:histidinol-phosphate aminotransferase